MSGLCQLGSGLGCCRFLGAGEQESRSLPARLWTVTRSWDVILGGGLGSLCVINYLDMQLEVV